MPMTGMLVLGGAGIASNLIGGANAANAASGDKAAAQAAYQKAYDAYANINIPDIQKQQLALQDPTVQGLLNPAMINASQNQQTTNAMAGIQTDPRLQQAQMNALNTMSQMGQQGLTPTDMAALNSSNRAVAGANQANQQSILQSLAQRGASGGGLELATRLQAAQGAADQAGQNSNNIMSQAQQRMLQAVAQEGQLGGQMQAQQFGQQSQQAQAANAIANFNAQQAAAAQNANVANTNAAQAGNLANAQTINNQAVATHNAQQQYNTGLQQQQFNNQMGLASAQANALVGQGNNFNAQGQQAAAMQSGIGAGVGQGFMGLAGVYGNQKPAATPVDPMAGWSGTGSVASSSQIPKQTYAGSDSFDTNV